MGRRESVSRMAPALGDALRETNRRGGAQPSWSPDGQRTGFSDYTGKQTGPPFNGHRRVYEAGLVTGDVHQLIPDVSGAANHDYWDNHAVWSHAAW